MSQVETAGEGRIGTELAGYRIEAKLGHGGMGVVYLAEHVHLGRKAALKLLLPELARDDAFRRRFVRESRLAASLHHPSVVTVYDAGEADGLLYIAMRYVEGTDLATLLRSEGALAPERALGLLGGVASGLDAAHALGLVHRDVKPANVLIGEEGGYLTDFGLTRDASSESALTAKGAMVGTVHYVAPEQIEGRPLDGRADLYSLACVLYQCLAGALPFERDSELSVVYAHMNDPPPRLSSVRPDLPSGFDGVIARALAKAPEDRYPTCSALISAAWRQIGVDRLEGPPGGGPPWAGAGQAPSRAVPAEGDEAWMETSVGTSPAAGAVPIPIAGDDPSAETSVGGPRPAVPVARALVVSGDPGTRVVIHAALGAARLELEDADDLASALALAGEAPADLLFLDASDEPARQAEAVRSDPTGAALRLLLLLDHAHAREGPAVLAAGADDYLVKPFSALQLLAAVRRLVGVEVVSG